MVYNEPPKLKVNYMKPVSLSLQDINNIVIKRASGVKQVDLANEYDSSTDRMLAVQKRNAHLISCFKIEKDEFYLARDPSFGDDEYPTLATKGDFVCNKIEITGNLMDGVLYANDIWAKDYADINGKVDELCMNEDDVGVFKTFVVGAVFSNNKSDCPFPVKSSNYNTKLDYGDNLYVLEKRKLDPKSTAKNVKIVVPKKPEKVELEIVLDKPKAEPVKADYVWNASSKFISISLGRDVWNADNSHPKFKEAMMFLVNDDVKSALDLINVEEAITRFVKGNIVIDNGELMYKGYSLKNGLSKRILTRMEEKKDFEFFLPFLENLMLNPSNKAVNRLFDFLEANDIEITKDGHFIAWKKITKDYKDIYTGKIDNSPGVRVEVSRNQVDEDDEKTCSHGLHVCSESYLKSYGNNDSIVVSVKVNPRDVVAIPKDYNNAKMRTCGYDVIKPVSK